MVGLVLVSHSHHLALAVKELVAATAGPKLALAIAAGAGPNHAELGTDATEIVEAIRSVMSEEGVLVLMDIGSALLSAETALGFLEESERARVRCAGAPFVEGAVAGGVVAALGSTLEEVAREASGALRHKRDHLGDAEPAASADSFAEPDHTIRLVVPNPHGLHARPAARFIREAAVFHAEIQVRNLTKERGPVSAKSLTSLASLEILHGHEIEISASGPDAELALQTLKRAVESGLGEPLTDPAKPADAAAPAPADAPVAVSPGLALGPLFFATRAEFTLPADRVEDAAREIEHLREAVARARSGMLKERDALLKSSARNEAEIFEAHAAMLDDPAMLGAAEAAIRARHENAALAWAHSYQAVAAKFEKLEDEYFRQRAADVLDIGASVLTALGLTRPRVGDLAEPGLLVAADLTPAEVTALPKTVLGVITLDGGKTSHAAILLRARGIPAIARARAPLAKAPAAAGLTAAFDGATGELWLAPDAAKLESLRARLQAQARMAAEAARVSHEPAVTADGHVTAIFANLGHPEEAAAALERGAEGVGLFRTEFLFLGRSSAPDEEEQYEALRWLREAMGTRPAVIRTLDIGGDKEAPYLGLPREANPFLGVRGIRLCLARPELFQTQLRAILRAGHGGNFRIMFPMIAELSELRAGRAALAQAHRTLEAARTPHAWPVPVGIMIEIPSAVMLSDQLAAEADFFSIGTNDLTQYTLAADRGHPELARFQDATHPAVLRLIERLVAEGRRHGKNVAVCGESAADPAAAGLLVGLGVDELSLTPAGIPALKSTLRAARKEELEAQALAALARAI